MTVLAYLPQHLAEVAGVALSVAFVGFGLLFLITGRGPSKGAEADEIRVGSRAVRVGPGWTRLIGLAAILLGVGVAVLSFVVDAEPPGGTRGGHWGTWEDRVLLAIWLLFLAGITIFNLRRMLK